MMKAFEDEWKHTLLGDKHKIIAETYWRYALEWVLDDDNNLIDRINKELEDK